MNAVTVEERRKRSSVVVHEMERENELNRSW